MRGLRGVVLCLGLICLMPLTAWANEVIGQVETLQGLVDVVRDGRVLPLGAGQEIHVNDAVRTGTDGTVGIVLEDGTSLSMGPDSRLVLDTFLYNPGLYNPGTRDVGLGLSFLRGTMQYISGRVAKIAPENVTLTTPSGTIGIRGTRFVLKVGGK